MDAELLKVEVDDPIATFVNTTLQMDAACGLETICVRRFDNISGTYLRKIRVSAPMSFGAIEPTYLDSRPTEAAGCESKITEQEVHLALKGVGQGKS